MFFSVGGSAGEVPLPTLSLQPTVKLFIDGKKVESQTDKFISNYNPATNEVISRVPCATPSEMNAAFEAAHAAFPAWKAKSVLSRQQIMFQFRDLIKKHWVRERGVVVEGVVEAGSGVGVMIGESLVHSTWI